MNEWRKTLIQTHITPEKLPAEITIHGENRYEYVLCDNHPRPITYWLLEGKDRENRTILVKAFGDKLSEKVNQILETTNPRGDWPVSGDPKKQKALMASAINTLINMGKITSVTNTENKEVVWRKTK